MKWIKVMVLAFVISLFNPTRVRAGAEVLGMHIMQPEEVGEVRNLFEDDVWRYVTVPYSVDDQNKDRWQEFLAKAGENKLVPLVRLMTRFNGDYWEVPSRYDVVRATEFLGSLNWPSDRIHVILFNEPNHAPEWGGQVDVASYVRITSFAADWLHTENKNFLVLPAGLDMAAANGGGTVEAYGFLTQVLKVEPKWLDKFNGWTSHSYPNPGFVGSPYDQSKMSIAGFKRELAFVDRYAVAELPVYITETGWKQTEWNEKNLANYWAYALGQVWNDKRVKTVTPFVWQGSPGPFEQFSFLNPDGTPTPQFEAVREVVMEEAGG